MLFDNINDFVNFLAHLFFVAVFSNSDCGIVFVVLFYNGKVVAKGSNKIKAGPLCVVSGSVVDFIGEVGGQALILP